MAVALGPQGAQALPHAVALAAHVQQRRSVVPRCKVMALNAFRVMQHCYFLLDYIMTIVLLPVVLDLA